MPDTKKKVRKPTAMTDAHKASLAAGRDEARVVKVYLDALQATAPRRRGRRRTVESITRRLAVIDQALAGSSSLKQLQLRQEKADLQAELASIKTPATADLAGARKAFIKAAKSYSQRKGITYATWRAMGVDAATLKDAGLTRSS